jgi:hypothetical protein
MPWGFSHPGGESQHVLIEVSYRAEPDRWLRNGAATSLLRMVWNFFLAPILHASDGIEGVSSSRREANRSWNPRAPTIAVRHMQGQRPMMPADSPALGTISECTCSEQWVLPNEMGPGGCDGRRGVAPDEGCRRR